MVDCGSLRCAQERRSLRRDLQTLSKKLPVILGLESIAGLYANLEEKQTDPANSAGGDEYSVPVCQDFQARGRCHYCNKKIPSIHKRIDKIICDVHKGKENKGKICLRSLQDLMPFCLDFYTHGFGRELFSDSVKSYFMMATPEVQEEDTKEVSCKSTSQPSSQIGELVVPYHTENSRPHKVKELPKPRDGNDKEDNHDELMKDTSLSEQLAMMYTIPHALLNSKILKTETENLVRDNPFQVLSKDTGFYPLPTPVPLSSSVFIQHTDYNNLPMIRNTHDIFASPFSPSLPSHEGVDLLRDLHLAHIRRLHNLNGSNRNQPPPAHGSQLKLPLLVNIVRKLVHERFMEIKRLHRKRHNEKSESVLEKESLNPLKAFGLRASPITSLRDESVHPRSSKRNETLSQHYNHQHDADSMLKHFGKVNECSRIGETLKDIIGKTISEKMKFREVSSDENSNPDYPKFYKMGSPQLCNPLSRASGSYKREADSTTQVDKDLSSSLLKRSKKEASKNRCYTSKSPIENNPKSLKKTRPKRGQYRKYNSQLLMDAVRAVQRGEMSVHRAGSFFGVPHSTLEYKVKERHLLRQRKGRDSSSLSSTSPPKSEAPLVTTINLSRDSSPALSEASLTSKKFNEPLSSKTSISSPSPISKQDERKNNVPAEPRSNSPLSAQISCPPFHLHGRSQEFPNVAWLSPYVSTTSQCDSTVRFPSPGVSLNTSASELLRKLQHKVQSKDGVMHETALQLPFTKDSAFEIGASKENSGELAESLTVFQ